MNPFGPRLRRHRASLIGTGVALSLVLAGCAQTETAGGDRAEGTDDAVAAALEEEGEVQLVTAGSTEQEVQAALLAEVLERLGGSSSIGRYTDGSVLMTEMGAADNMVLPDFWRWQNVDTWDKFVETDKTVVSWGTTDYSGEEGWYVPTYVIEGDEERGIEATCPGLPSWEALNDCKDAFATSKTGDKGQYVEGAEAWAPYYGDQDRIDNLGLDYEMVFAGSEAALFADLQRAYERGEPWLGLMWRPNFMTQKLDLTRVDFPEYSEECWATDHACQWPETVIYKIASAGMQTEHPTAWKVLENYEMPDERLAELQKSVIDDNMTPVEAAEKWADENVDVWTAWGQV